MLLGVLTKCAGLVEVLDRGRDADDLCDTIEEALEASGGSPATLATGPFSRPACQNCRTKLSSPLVRL